MANSAVRPTVDDASSGSGVTVEVDVREPDWRSVVAGPEALCARAADVAFAAGGGPDAPVEISIVLGDDRFVAELNRAFRGMTGPTNVLSFPGDAADGPVTGARAGDAPLMLGDIAVAFETVRDEAGRDGKSVSDHLAHLIVHGVLHLLAYDHIEIAEAARMEAREIEALARLGVADPYGVAAAEEAERSE